MKRITLFLATVFIAFTSYSQNQSTERSIFSGNGMSDTTAYEINTAAQLARLAELVNTGDVLFGTYFKLTADINLSAYDSRFNNGKGWIPIGTFSHAFSGHFNGNNHTINGLYINDPELEFAGLFGVIIDGGSIQNLSVEANITGDNHVGGIAGGIGYFSNITNCNVVGDVSGNGSVGGVAGQVGGSISNCYAAGEVNGAGIVGGIAGSVNNNGIIANCYATSAVSGNYFVGGVAGHLYQSTVQNSAALNPSITRTSGEHTEFGRVAGHNEEGTLTGNVAREDMFVIDDIVRNTDGSSLDGVDIDKDILSRDATIGGRFNTSNRF